MSQQSINLFCMFLGRLGLPKGLTSAVHILLPVTDKCPFYLISRRPDWPKKIINAGLGFWTWQSDMLPTCAMDPSKHYSFKKKEECDHILMLLPKFQKVKLWSRVKWQCPSKEPLTLLLAISTTKNDKVQKCRPIYWLKTQISPCNHAG